MREKFEIAIAADRYDKSTRLVFADWLEEHGFDDEAAEQRTWTKEKQEKQDATAWMHDFAERSYLEYDECLEAARSHVEHGGTYDTGINMSPENNMEGETVREFWKAYELIAGKKVADDAKTEYVFACSC